MTTPSEQRAKRFEKKFVIKGDSKYPYFRTESGLSAMQETKLIPQILTFCEEEVAAALKQQLERIISNATPQFDSLKGGTDKYVVEKKFLSQE